MIPVELPEKFIPSVQASKRPIVHHASIQIGGETKALIQRREAVNPARLVWQLRWVALPEPDGDELAAFFEARRGVGAILWQPPDRLPPLLPLRWIVKQPIQRQYTRSRHSTITATFEQDFNI